MSATRDDTVKPVEPNLTAIRFALAELEGELRCSLRLGLTADRARAIGLAIETMRKREFERDMRTDYLYDPPNYAGD